MKADIFVLTVMVGLLVLATAGISLATGNWAPLIAAGISLALAGVILAIQIPLMVWADKRWGQR